jgi:hypothetical protein
MRMRLRLVMAVLVLGWVCVSCAKPEPDPYFRITAAGLEPHLPPGSLAAQLSPAERQALDDQGYDIAVDHDDWAEQAALEAKDPGHTDEAPGGLQRAMDHVGKATVAVSSVALAVGMVVAPFFLF